MGSPTSTPTTLDYVLNRVDSFAPLTAEQWIDVIEHLIELIRPRQKYNQCFGLEKRFENLLDAYPFSPQPHRDMRIIHKDSYQLFILTRPVGEGIWRVDLENNDWGQVSRSKFLRYREGLLEMLQDRDLLGQLLVAGILALVTGDANIKRRRAEEAESLSTMVESISARAVAVRWNA